MARFFDVNGELMYEPDPTAGTTVVRKATKAEKIEHGYPISLSQDAMAVVGLWKTIRNWIK